MGKRILITGGAGFIGQHLCQRLIDDGNTVVCLDNLSTGHRKNARGTFFWKDIREFDNLAGAIHEIYNLACPASPEAYQRLPRETFDASVKGVRNLLLLANRKNAYFLQASTSEVYGDPQESPQKETYWGHVNTIGPRACYDEGKRAAETYIRISHHPEKCRIGRIFNTYGPGMARDDGRVVSNFIVQSLAGDDITVYGDGSQTRSFCYVEDTVDALVRLMASDYQLPVNIGNPSEVTVQELAERIIKLTESSSKIINKDLPEDDPKRRCPDITLAKKELDWKPKVSLEEGLKRTIEAFR